MLSDTVYAKCEPTVLQRTLSHRWPAMTEKQSEHVNLILRIVWKGAQANVGFTEAKGAGTVLAPQLLT